MATGRVVASAEDLRKLARALAAYQAEVSTAAKKVQRSLDAAYWHDDRKSKFEVRYRELQRTIDRFLSNDVQAMAKDLQTLAQRLDDLPTLRG